MESIHSLSSVLSNSDINFLFSLSFISSAARTVKVTTKIESISTLSFKIKFAIFSIITVVFPLPAPALTN